MKMSNSREPIAKIDYLTVPKIMKMNATSDKPSEDDENGLGYHHTLVSFKQSKLTQI